MVGTQAGAAGALGVQLLCARVGSRQQPAPVLVSLEPGWPFWLA